MTVGWQRGESIRLSLRDAKIAVELLSGRECSAEDEERKPAVARLVRDRGVRLIGDSLYLGDMQIVCWDDTEAIRRIIKGAHVGTSHGCWPKTFAKIRQRFVGLTALAVRDYVSRCGECLRFNGAPGGRKHRRPTRPMRTDPEPWKHIQVDLVDLSRLSRENDGFSWVLTCVDHFTRYAAVEPLLNKTMEETRRALWRIFLRYGIPSVWQSDNGKEFVNHLTTSLLEEFSVDVRHGRPRKPTSQGSVERFNQDLVVMLGKTGAENGEAARARWIDRLDAVVFYYNGRHHRAIGMSPFKLMFGRDAFVEASGVSLEEVEEVEEATDEQVRRFLRRKEKTVRRGADEEARYDHGRSDGATKLKAFGSVVGEGDLVMERTTGTEDGGVRRKMDALYEEVGKVVSVDETNELVVVKTGAGSSVRMGLTGCKVVPSHA